MDHLHCILIPVDRRAPGLAGRHFGPARQLSGRIHTIPFVLAKPASVGSTVGSTEATSARSLSVSSDRRAQWEINATRWAAQRQR